MTGPRLLSFGEARERLGGLRAVVVDADPEASGRIFVSLSQAGAQVRLARGFRQGVVLLEEVRPQLALLSTRLPDGDSLKLLNAGEGGATLAVAIGATESRVERRRFREAGCVAFLCKPIDLHLFAQQLASALAVTALATVIRL